MNKPVCVIVGAGPGNGAAIAARFADAGYYLALLARSADSIKQLASRFQHATAYQCDATNKASIEHAFLQIKHDPGSIDVLSKT